MKFAAGVFGCFLLWTFCMYWLHRWSHIAKPGNLLWKIHVAHHQIPYLSRATPDVRPTPGQFVFWLGGWRESLDVIVVMTLPLVLITLAFPQYGLPLLVFHYFYEVFLSEGLLDHNPRVKGPVTRYFAWGHFHLFHHINLKVNYGLIVTWWDHLFGTARHPAPDRIPAVIAARQRRSERLATAA
ncbi:MAG: sterol desaturase family protein [Pseudomonadota bacterium]